MSVRLAALIAGVLVLASAMAGRTQAAPLAATALPGFERDVRPVLSQYCFSCHNPEKHKGDVILNGFTNEAAVLADRGTWEKVLKNLRANAMPPENKPQPSSAQRQLVANWIENKLFFVDCNHPDPGRVTIHRLNRAEYNNTIRDLVGVDFHPADDFPADDVGYGFDNIGDVLSMPPILLEKYLSAAEKILDAAVVVPEAKPRAQRYPALGLAGAPKTEYTSRIRALQSGGEIFVDHPCSREGEYAIKVRAFQQQAGDEPAKLLLRAAGRDVQTFQVRGSEQKPEIYEAMVRLQPGTNRFALEFVNPVTITNTPEGQSRGKENRGRSRTRRLMLEYVDIVEPSATAGRLPESHRKIFICDPTHRDAGQCARQVVSRFAQRAFRRPVSDGEIDRLLRIYKVARKEGDSFERGVQLALEAVLVSPHFLFRGEVGRATHSAKSPVPIDDYALASRLSYFLWSSMPDDDLFALAAKGELHKPAQIDAQVKRMLRDPKARSLVENFTGQWLQIRNLAKAAPDTNMFAGFTEEVRADMERETQLFFGYVMREDRSLLDFIDGSYTFANQRLAAYYGLPAVKGDGFQKVAFNDKTRGGVITHGSILTITSNPTRTSPVKRGKWVLDNLLGTPPPPPPPDVPDLKDQKELTGTFRQKLEEHRKNPSCASCHDRMDPIGFGLENFDAAGRWRDKEGEAPVDSSGTLPSGERFSGPAQLRAILRRQKDLFAHCLTEKMLTYALGRGLEYYDRCAVDKITSALADKNYRFSVLITEIVKSVPFQMRRGDVDAGGPEVTQAAP